MFRLNFKIALRNLWKNKTASLINISGLGIGLAACLILLLYVSYQWNYDKQSRDSNQIYQVMINFHELSGQITGTGDQTPNTIGPELKERYPEVKAMSRVSSEDLMLLANGRTSFKKNVRFADPDLLKIIDYYFIAGDQKTALNAPNNIVVTETMARLLFGTTDVLNRSVRFEDKVNLKITGVIRDLPENMSVRFDYLLPWSLFESQYQWVKIPEWTSNNWMTLVKVNPGTDVSRMNSLIGTMIKKHAPEVSSEPFLYPFERVHLYGTFTNGKNTGGEIEQVRLFMGLAIGILLIACINFMNMATAKSEKRAKEVGIKKTIGATRGSLIIQFLTESLVLTLFSAILAIILVEVGLPLFNNLLDIQMDISYANPVLWLFLSGIVVFTGIIAGSYPAFYLSAFNPLQVFKKRNPAQRLFNISLRQILVVIQFSFAVILMIATTVIYKQLQYIKNKPAGYQMNQLVEIPQDGMLNGKFELLRERLIRSGSVSAMCQLSGSMSDYNSNFWGLEWPGADEADRHVVFSQLATTYDFVKTTGVKLIQGRDFSRQFASDSASVLLSVSAVKRMNLSKPIGTVVKYHGQSRSVIGVFEDFIWGSPFKTNEPMLVAFDREGTGFITLRLNSSGTAASNLSEMEHIIKEINPAYPVSFSFVDQLYAKKLKSQHILSILANIFGGLAIFISCLGLFGLAAYSAEQRTKEIGVRKVLGASVASLMQLLSLNFVKTVLIAIAIAVPIANYIMNSWLRSFEFHTTVSWLMIVAAATLTVIIALLTVSFQAYKAANANPVDALKYE